MYWEIFKGIMVAQLGLPIGFALFSVATGLAPVYPPQLVGLFMSVSLFGLFYSVPISLLFAYPLAVLLCIYGKLKLNYILPISMAIPIGFSVHFGSISGLPIVLLVTIIGSLIFGWYVSNSSALKSQSCGRRPAAPT